MTYSAARHAAFVQRLINMRAAINDLNSELNRLLPVYTHEAAGGTHVDFADLPNGGLTKAEVEAFITLLTGLQTTLTSGANAAIMAPFTKV